MKQPNFQHRLVADLFADRVDSLRTKTTQPQQRLLQQTATPYRWVKQSGPSTALASIEPDIC